MESQKELKELMALLSRGSNNVNVEISDSQYTIKIKRNVGIGDSTSESVKAEPSIKLEPSIKPETSFVKVEVDPTEDDTFEYHLHDLSDNNNNSISVIDAPTDVSSSNAGGIETNCCIGVSNKEATPTGVITTPNVGNLSACNPRPTLIASTLSNLWANKAAITGVVANSMISKLAVRNPCTASTIPASDVSVSNTATTVVVTSLTTSKHLISNPFLASTISTSNVSASKIATTISKHSVSNPRPASTHSAFKAVRPPIPDQVFLRFETRFFITEMQIHEEFVRFGDIREVRLIREQSSGALRGYGFVKFFHPGCAQLAISAGVAFVGNISIKIWPSLGPNPNRSNSNLISKRTFPPQAFAPNPRPVFHNPPNLRPWDPYFSGFACNPVSFGSDYAYGYAAGPQRNFRKHRVNPYRR